MFLSRHGRHRRADARISLIMVLTFAMTLVVGVPAYAQDDPAADTEAFQATVTEARDAAQARLDEGQQVAEDGCDGLAQEACLKQFLTVQFALEAQENAAFADLLEGLDAPDVYADDVAAQVAALRDISAFLQEATTAAEAADAPLMIEGLDAMSDTLVSLSARLSPEYARFAFLPADAADSVSDFGGSTPEEVAYIQGIGSVGQAAASNFDCFGRTLQSSYGGTDALLGALYDCGAGTALAAIEEAGKQLTPPESFADEHAWWLAAAAEATRLDGLIGEAAREGDVVKFIANNVRLGLTQRPYRGIDPRFLAAFGPANGRVDPDTELGRSEYGQTLFAALLDYEFVSPGRLAENLDFPQVPTDVALGAVAQLAPELLAIEADIRETLEALVPPDEFAADQALMLDYANGLRDRLDQFIEAAATGDIEAADMIHDAEHAQYCAVANELSDDIRTITAVFFDTEHPDCR